MNRITHFSLHITWDDHQFEVLGNSLPAHLLDSIEQYCTELEDLRADLEKNRDLGYYFTKDKPWNNH